MKNETTQNVQLLVSLAVAVGLAFAFSVSGCRQPGSTQVLSSPISTPTANVFLSPLIGVTPPVSPIESAEPATPVATVVACNSPIQYKIHVGSPQEAGCSNVIAPPLDGTCDACFSGDYHQLSMTCFNGKWQFTGSQDKLAFVLERYNYTPVTDQMKPSDIRLTGKFASEDRTSFSGVATMVVDAPAFGDCTSPFSYTTEFVGEIIP
jgi:hypothetical protein